MSGEENKPAAAAPPQCQFFVQRKKRLCRMTVKPGRQYCGEHQPQPDAEAALMDKRIPCPNDPKHTCYASKLVKHLAVCNARRTEQPPYIVHNINAPEAVDTCPRLPLSSYPKDTLACVIEKVNHLYAKHVDGHIAPEPAQPAPRAVQAELGAAGRAEGSRRHLRQVAALLRAAERAGLPAPSTCYVELGAGKGQLSYYAAHAWCAGTGSRVLCVDRAPLRHKRDNKLRSAPPGGHVGLPDLTPHEDTDTPSSATTNNKRFKSDISSDKHLNTESELSESKNGACESDVAVRIRADLAHLVLEAVPVVAQSDSFVGLAKHLCGVATDLALRCVAGAGRGALLATCCHHRVQRALYVAAAQLQDLGINEEEFNIMLGIVSWATCGDGRSRERRRAAEADAQGGHESAQGGPEDAPGGQKDSTGEEKDSPGGQKDLMGEEKDSPGGEKDTPEGKNASQGFALRTQSEREETGRRAKALLDWGRVLWLRERGFDARLCYYVPRDVSLENVAIVAVKR